MNLFSDIKGCFTPRRKEWALENVLDGYQREQSVCLEAFSEQGEIHVCSSDNSGRTLLSLCMNEIDVSTCALPGQNSCVCIRFKEPQVRELLFKATSMASAAKIARQLQTATRQYCLQNCVDGGVEEEQIPNPQEEELRREVERVGTELVSAKEKLQEQKNKNNIQEKEIEKLRNEVKQSKAEIKRSTEFVYSYEIRVRQLETEKSDLRAQLQERALKCDEAIKISREYKIKSKEMEQERKVRLLDLSKPHPKFEFVLNLLMVTYVYKYDFKKTNNMQILVDALSNAQAEIFDLRQCHQENDAIEKIKKYKLQGPCQQYNG